MTFSASFERRPLPTSAHNTRSTLFSRSLMICMFDNQSVQLKHLDAQNTWKRFPVTFLRVCTEPLKHPDSLRRPWHLRPLSCWWWKRRIPKCSEEKCGNAKGMFYHNIRMHWYSVYMCPKSIEAWRQWNGLTGTGRNEGGGALKDTLKRKNKWYGAQLIAIIYTFLYWNSISLLI